MVSRSLLSAAFIGQGTLLVRCAEAFSAAGHRVAAVVSSEPRIKEWAAGNGVRLLAPGRDLAPALAGLDIDYLFSVANMQVVRPDVLAVPRRGAINFHDALLPRYAGAHATSWAILGGETQHGVTWHEMIERVDAGRILKQRVVDVAPDETAVSLNAKCYEAGIVSFAELVDELATGTATYADPQLAQRTYFPLHRRPANAGVLRWDRPAAELYALARALDFGPSQNPLGVPKVDLGADILLAPRVEPLPVTSRARPGTVVGLDGDSVIVATATEDVRLSELMTTDGRRLGPAELVQRLGLSAGAMPAPAATVVRAA